MRYFLLLFLTALMTPAVFAQTAGSDYKIYSTTLKKEVAIADIVQWSGAGTGVDIWGAAR